MVGGHAFAQELTVSPELLVLREISERLAALPNGLRQTLADHLWASIPVTITEWTWNDALAAGTPMQVNPQTGALELITSVAASVPAGATGVMQLGSGKFYLSAGLTLISPVALLLATSDLRQLTISGASGPAMMLLCGEQRPTFGVMAK